MKWPKSETCKIEMGRVRQGIGKKLLNQSAKHYSPTSAEATEAAEVLGGACPCEGEVTTALTWAPEVQS